MNCSCRQ